jgi:hypothetical protein
LRGVAHWTDGKKRTGERLGGDEGATNP